MLEAIRKRTGSWVIKLLVAVLVVVFAYWGIADIFAPGSGETWIAKVDDVAISPEATGEAYQREMNRMRAAFGDDFDDERARAFGLPQLILSQQIDRTVLDVGARDLGLTASDAMISATIRDNPAFRDETGRFNLSTYENLLRGSGFTPSAYEAAVRGDLVREQLIDTISAGATVPAALVDTIMRHRLEERVAQYVRIDNASITDIGAPSEAELEDFYQERETMFSAPEYRSITAIVLSTEDIRGEINVPSSDVEALYAERIDSYSLPERRSVRQMVFNDRDTAEQARRRVADGEVFAAVATEMTGVDAATVDLGMVREADLLGELGDVVFALPPGTVSEPVESPLGWHLFEVVAIEPAATQPLDAVREQLADEIAGERALDALYDMTARLEDQLGGGARLEDAAATLNLPLRRLDAVDRHGMNRDGAAVENLPSGLLDTAFELDEGSPSDLTDAADGSFFVARVDAVFPETLKPLADVRDAALQAWRAAQQAERAKAKADAIAAQVANGTPLKDAATAEGLNIETTLPLTRAGAEAEGALPGPLVANLFESESGDPVVVQAFGSAYAATVTDVIKADVGSDSPAATELTSEMERAIGADLVAQLTAALRDRYAIEINQAVFDQTF